jgi:pyrimidine-nucleoside phosphorylase
MPSLIAGKRDGRELDDAEIRAVIAGAARGDIPDYQLSALLMAIVWRGMTARELVTWTAAMIDSGERLRWTALRAPAVDKHSTGGVGDKISLALAPLCAACGLTVPMIAGRALGHTGGTLDKLEAIPGFKVALTPREFGRVLEKAGFVLAGQSKRMAPADGVLYALRDATATVESIPLIASSIMSKKLAEGVDAMVLDVKVGNGAFMKRQIDARRLAQMMVGIGRRMDKRVQALITDMSQPLGYAVGNALEVMEASQTLQNAGPADLTRLCIELAARMIHLAKKAPSLEDARRTAEQNLVDGSAYRKFKQVIEAQGGNAQALDKFELLPNATGMREILSPRAGYVSVIDAEDIGTASSMIGAGRQRKEDTIDPAVGVILEVKVGEKVDAGSVLCRLYYTKEDQVEEAAEMVEDAFRISAQRPEERELILEVVG